MRIPSIDGAFETWMPFRDAFCSLIHKNSNPSDIDKLHYLNGSLVHDAQKIIGGIEITAANYTVAWELLNERYNNKKLIAKKYLDGLFAIPVMKRESYEALTDLMDGFANFERSVNMTKKMGHCQRIFDKRRNRVWSLIVPLSCG